MQMNSEIIVTDLDCFIGLGYTESAVREALLTVQGNRNAALYLLARGEPSAKMGQLAWRKNTPNDWVDGLAVSVPTLAENRALHRSPIFIFVKDYYRGKDDVEYTYMMEITLRDGRQWNIQHTYPEFCKFWQSLPYGSCRTMKNGFPPSATYQLAFGELSKTFLDKRLVAIGEWTRELVLNEACMSNPAVLNLMYDFIEADKNGGKVGENSKLPRKETSHNSPNVFNQPNTTSPLLLDTQDSTEIAASRHKSLFIENAPLLSLDQLPITANQATQAVPFRVSMHKLQCYHDLMGMKLSRETQRVEQNTQVLTEQPADQSVDEDTELAAALAESAAMALQAAEELATEELALATALAESALPPVPEHEIVVNITSSPLHETAKKLFEKVDTPPEQPAVGHVNDEAHPSVSEQRAASVPIGHDEQDEVADCHFPLSALVALQGSTSLSAKIDDMQLKKDCRRDRLVVQGKRLEGSQTTLEDIYALCEKSILQVISLAGKQAHQGGGPARLASTNPFDETDCPTTVLTRSPTSRAPVGPQCMLQTDEELAAELQRLEYAPAPTRSPVLPPAAPSLPGAASFSLMQDCALLGRVALSMISRSESGYLSHASLYEIFDTDNSRQDASFVPFFFVPEATLSDPLHLRFSVREKGGTPQAARGKFAQPSGAQEWCVVCEGETSTVYRLLNATSLEPLLQIRVTYQISLHGIPQYQSSCPRLGATGALCGLHIKEGKCHLLVDKVTATTSRDWVKEPQRM